MIRIFNTYGPNMHPKDGRVISNFVMQALNNQDITLYGDGSQTRSFQFVDDLIAAMQTFMDMEQSIVNTFFDSKDMEIPVLNVGNPDEYTIKELAEETLCQIPKCTSKLIYLPLPKDDPRRRRPDITLAQELLNWSPRVTLSAGLSKTIEYFKGVAK